MVMPPVLPIELHEEIIECLLWYRPMYYATLEAEPELEFTSSKETLAACALTCKAWLYICRKHLYRLIRISDPRRFDALTRELPVLSQLISKVTEFVHITDDTDTSPFSHLAPHYLSTRAPHVKDLFLGSERFDSPHFRFHSTSIMLLAQFRNVRTLRMSNFFFTSSTELRRVIGSFTNLVSTTLSGLTWDNQVAYPPQLLRTTCWRLSQVRMYDCSSNHDGFWFWIVPPLRAPSNNFVGFGGENSHFGLTLHDAYALSDLFRACLSVNGKPNGNPGAFFDWEYLTKQNTCEHIIIDSSRL